MNHDTIINFIINGVNLKQAPMNLRHITIIISLMAIFNLQFWTQAGEKLFIIGIFTVLAATMAIGSVYHFSSGTLTVKKRLIINLIITVNAEIQFLSCAAASFVRIFGWNIHMLILFILPTVLATFWMLKSVWTVKKDKVTSRKRAYTQIIVGPSVAVGVASMSFSKLILRNFGKNGLLMVLVISMFFGACLFSHGFCHFIRLYYLQRLKKSGVSI